MATVEFARAFRRHVECPVEEVDGSTLGDVLDGYFDRHPTVRGYVLDDRGEFRKHITLFVDDEQVDHRRGAAAAVRPSSTVYVFQALSGGGAMTVPDVLVATRKGLFRVDGGCMAPVGFVGVPVTIVATDRRDGTILAGVDHGHFGVKVHRSDDGGRSWHEVASPTYPQPAAGEQHTDPVRGEDVEWTTKLVWALEPGHPDDPGAWWCGTIPGGLFRSTDRGDSWQLVRSLWDDPTRTEWFGGGYDHPGIHSVSVDPRDAADVLVGISCGGTWRTRDGGASWTVSTGLRAGFMPEEMATTPHIQDPHRLARCAAEPDVVWCQHHSGMFRSTDGGSSWEEITDVQPSNFGFAVAAHPKDPDTAWFVPAVSDEVRIPVDGRVVVNRTRDGGRSFEAIGDGLPSAHAYHLVYRHGLAVDASGDHLVLGSTTGSLWASDDGGDSFRTLTTDLPPIAAVTFA